MCSSHGFVMVGDYNERFLSIRRPDSSAVSPPIFCWGDRYFIGAALLMLSDRLIVAISKTRYQHPESIRHSSVRFAIFRKSFLRFTHRYWFHEGPSRSPPRLFKRWSDEWGTDQLFAETAKRSTT